MTPESKHVLDVLRTALRVLGFSNREIERKLEASPGYLSRVFSGAIALRHDLIVEIARAMGLEPGEIFRAAYPPPAAPSSAAATKLRQAVASFTSAPSSPPEAPGADLLPSSPLAGGPLSQVEIELMMARALRRVFREWSDANKATG